MIAPPLAPQWIDHPKRDPERAASLARALGAPLPVGHVLVHRGVDSLESARRFLDPAIEDLHDPFQLLGLDGAVDRIRRAIDAHESILIHGDYDVDGITSTFLLYSVLRDLGAKVDYRIPHRTRDGYGLSLGAIAEAQRRGCTLVVTVDCGITAIEPVAHAKTLGIDVVIIDHHEVPAVLPEAVAIVNPLRKGCPYPFKSLAGVGVTFKLVEALLRHRGGLDRARDFLDVVALGTIADVVPLVGENRVLARLGLERINENPRLGLRALIDVSSLAGRRITSGQVAFVLAPRINAAGRMGNAEQGIRLLLARESGEARVCAESLEEDSLRRRQHDEVALQEAAQRVTTELDYPNCSSIMLWSETWHPGVIGIVASRLVERFQRPTVLVALDGERGRGSGRSLAGLDLNRLLGRCSDLLDGYGGHAFAAGLSVQRDRLPELRARIEKIATEELSADHWVPRVPVDAEVKIGECHLDLVEWLERLSPHGLDNSEPLFVSRGVTVMQSSAVGGGKHLRLTVRDATGTAEAIGFGLGARSGEVGRSKVVDLAFVPVRNEWMGETRLQLKVKGVRVS